MFEYNYKSGDLKKLQNEKVYGKWLTALIESHSRQAGELSYTFLSDEDLLEMNMEYLGHDTYTDIITFDYTEEDIVSGDIFISTDRVRANAAEYGVDFKDELDRVMAHGILHLIAYGDHCEEDIRQMRQEEDSALDLRKNFKFQ